MLYAFRFTGRICQWRLDDLRAFAICPYIDQLMARSEDDQNDDILAAGAA